MKSCTFYKNYNIMIELKNISDSCPFVDGFSDDRLKNKLMKGKERKCFI